MIIALASDHAGFEQKQQLAIYLQECGHKVIDCGPAAANRVDYPDYALAVGKAVASGVAQRGVLVCGTGIGMAVAACKIPGIRAVNIVREDFAVLARQHNDANVITLSGRFVSLEENKHFIDVFLSTEFAGGRHADRVKKINALDSWPATEANPPAMSTNAAAEANPAAKSNNAAAEDAKETPKESQNL